MITSLSTITSHHSIILHHSSCVGAWLHLRHGESAVGPAFSWISATYATLEYIRYNSILIYIYIYTVKAHTGSDSSCISFLAVVRLKSVQRSAHPEGSVCSLAIALVGCRNFSTILLDVFAQLVARMRCNSVHCDPCWLIWIMHHLMILSLRTSGCLVVGAHGPHAIEPMPMNL